MEERLVTATGLYQAGKRHFADGTHSDAYECWTQSLGMLNEQNGNNDRMLKADCLTMLASLEMLRNRFGSANDMLIDACRLNPKKPSCVIYLAQVLFMLGMHGRAQETAERAVKMPPASPLAWQTLGNIYSKTGQKEKAREAYQAGAQLSNSEAEQVLMLAHNWHWGGDRVEAEKWYKVALVKDPEHPDVNYHYASFLLEDMRLEESKACYEKASKSDKNRENSLWNISIINLTLGNYKEGWKQYDIRHDFLNRDHGADKAAARLNTPLWAGQPGSIHIHSEQGFGDTLQFCRYVPLVAESNKVVFETFEGMIPLMKFNYPNVEVVPMASNYPGVAGIPKCDFQIPLMSLPHAFGTTLETIPNEPYLKAQPEFIEKWHQILSERMGESWKSFRIGLCWAGGQRPESPDCMSIDSRRSIHFAKLQPLLNVPNTTFVSLQLGPPQFERDDPRVADISEEMKTWSDTAGAIANLDLIITVDTAVCHLAAAMGKDVYLLNRFDTCWRWLLERNDSPWYPSVVQFRQPKMGDWDSVIADVAAAIQ